MRWMITGAGGMVGTELRAALKRGDQDVLAVGREELDITDRDAVLYLMKQARPDAIVNCAAYTKVDDAENDEATATAVNGTAVEHLAEGANRWSALLVQISTDFVFDGTSRRPYEESDTPAPLSAYGRSKLAGEVAAKKATKHFIIRTSWLFGRNGWNFVEAIRKQLNAGKKELRVVNDQRGRPTYAPHLAAAILRLVQFARTGNSRGIVHYADQAECTWFDFAEAIVRMLGSDATVHPVTTDEFPRPARRPSYSVLSTTRYQQLTGVTPESWEEGLREYLDADARDTQRSLQRL